MANESLSAAKAAKNDEFYTQYYDIEREINAYLEYDPDVFRDKTVLLPCDDPEWSNFTLYFAQHFQTLGLKKLISTSYAAESKKYRTPYQPSLFEQDAPQFDPAKTSVRGKIFVLDHDIDGDGRIDFHDLEWRYLDGDGDFRSAEVTALRDQADIIVTNPPFSLFREFFAWVMQSKKEFSLIANKSSITYKEVFPCIKDNKIWIGRTSMSKDLLFDMPKEFADEIVKTSKSGSKYKVVNDKIMGRSPSIWLTNIDHGQRHQPLSLMTMDENIMYSKHKEIRGKGYAHYDNYDAIEVPYTDAIPSDYYGIMGVPISFLGKYCPEQFEILGITKTWFGGAIKTYPEQLQVSSNGRKKQVTKLNDGAVLPLDSEPNGETYYIVESKLYKQVYARVLIKRLSCV